MEGVRQVQMEGVRQVQMVEVVEVDLLLERQLRIRPKKL